MRAWSSIGPCQRRPPGLSRAAQREEEEEEREGGEAREGVGGGVCGKSEVTVPTCRNPVFWGVGGGLGGRGVSGLVKRLG